jgi:hypothetical protein
VTEPEVATVEPVRLVAVEASTTRDVISVAIRDALDRVWAEDPNELRTELVHLLAGPA